jgi:predicted nucleotidyltransferase
VEGSPDESSDIDIAAVSPAADTMDASTKVALVVDVERRAGASVDLYLYGTN